MDNPLINNSFFHSEDVGRGIWHSWHSVGFSATDKSDITSLYHIILIYNKVIRCKTCAPHSNSYIDETSESLYNVLKDINLTNSEIIDYFNRWLYEYHKRANEYAGKSSPSYDDIAEYYLNFEYCEDCGIKK